VGQAAAVFEKAQKIVKLASEDSQEKDGSEEGQDQP